MAVSRKTRAARWGGALLVALAPLPWLGFGSAQAADSVVYAEVTGHEAFSSDANHADYWGDDCDKIVDGGSLSSYVLTKDYALVIVKAGAGNVDPFTNTLFANASAGETVWADTNGNSVYDPGGKNGDKTISHIIVCGPGVPESSPPVSSSAPASSSAPVSSSAPASSTKPVTTHPTTKPVTTHPTTKPVTTHPTTKPPVTETQTTGSASPSTSSSSAAPSTSSSSAAPSTSISTQESGTKTPKSSSPGVTEVETTGGALPKTGPDVPISGAVGISLLLIAIGALLLLGPGRLIPSSYHRKH